MNAVATYAAKPRSKDVSEIMKMVLIGAITLVLMAVATLGSVAAQAEKTGPSLVTGPFEQQQVLVKKSRPVRSRIEITIPR